MRVLFVCVENSNRSQMAEAFARMYGSGVLESASAGPHPAGSISQRAIAAMGELGYDLTTHRSKGLPEVDRAAWDYVITMGCGDACPNIAASRRQNWELPDPTDLPDEEFRKVRDEIGRRVLELLEQVRASAGWN